MRVSGRTGLTSVAALLVIFGKAAPPLASQGRPDHKKAEVTVYSAQSGATSPVLMPSQMSILPSDNCQKKVDGRVSLYLVVDSLGMPRNLVFDHPLGSDLDRFALKIVEADRFKPGTLNGEPVAVAERVEVEIQTCLEHGTNQSDPKDPLLRLRTAPTQNFTIFKTGQTSTVLTDSPDQNIAANGRVQSYQEGAKTTPPVPLIIPEVSDRHLVRTQGSEAICLFSVLVDSQGMPQDIKLVRSVSHDFDEKAAEAVRRYRFRPAMNGTEPVPIRITVEVIFKLN